MSSVEKHRVPALEVARPTKTAFELLVVCTANRCRSPAVAAILDQGAKGLPGLAASGIHVTSAGTSGAEGVPMDARTARALRKAGYDAPESLSRGISTELVESADLILTASRRHRTQIVRMSPEALAKTFTMREFARYCLLALEHLGDANQSPAERLSVAVAFAQNNRGLRFPAQAEDEDIPDPAGRSRWAHRRTLRMIVDSLSPLLAVVSRGSASGTP